MISNTQMKIAAGTLVAIAVLQRIPQTQNAVIPAPSGFVQRLLSALNPFD